MNSELRQSHHRSPPCCSSQLSRHRQPRVAFFTDSLNEVNGLALTSRHLTSFAQRRQIPLLCVHQAEETEYIKESPTNSVATLRLGRSRAAFAVDHNMYFDPLLWRHIGRAAAAVQNFNADCVHVTSPGDVGQLGAYIAHRLRIPLIASWHTNLHEFGRSRLQKLLDGLPANCTEPLANLAERNALRAVVRFYKLARVLLAPNAELINLLARLTGRRTYLMQRGVDTALFSPAKRARGDRVFQLGFVGRLTAEKNVRFLLELEQALVAAGRDFRFVIVGDGGERAWLEENLQHAEFTGVLTGERLAEVYAGMDLFVFPSRTDTFGNVILEAAAAGVPAIVTAQGGPKYLVQNGVTGYVASDNEEFIAVVLRVMADLGLRKNMCEAARQVACAASWDTVFEKVYAAYDTCLPNPASGSGQLEVSNNGALHLPPNSA